MAPKRIGLIGYGMNGSAIANAARDEGFADVAFAHPLDRDEAAEALPRVPFIDRLSDVTEQQVDLVVEAATADVVRDTVRRVLSRDYDTVLA